MSRDQLSTYRTTISTRPEGKSIVYHETAIVEFDAEKVRLHSGGWRTVTTKKKMNQASRQFGLGFEVYQKAREWFIVTPEGETVPFYDGIYLRKK